MTEPQYGPPAGKPIQLPPPTTSKRKVWPWLLGVLIVASLLFTTCGFFGYRLLKSPTGAGTLFATAIQMEDYALAYDSLCETSKQELTFEQFKDDYVPSQKVESVEPVTISLVGEGDSDEFVVKYVLADGSSESVEYPMVRENGDWHICEPPKLS